MSLRDPDAGEPRQPSSPRRLPAARVGERMRGRRGGAHGHPEVPALHADPGRARARGADHRRPAAARIGRRRLGVGQPVGPERAVRGRPRGGEPGPEADHARQRRRHAGRVHDRDRRHDAGRSPHGWQDRRASLVGLAGLRVRRRSGRRSAANWIAGTYQLRAEHDAGRSAARPSRQGPPPNPIITIGLREGLRLEQITALLEKLHHGAGPRRWTRRSSTTS